MKRHFRTFIVLVATAVAGVAPLAGAKAQGLTPVQEIVEACRADYFRLCPGVRPGGGRILDCLSSYQRQLSAPCHEALIISIAIRSCRFDYNRFCRHLDPFGGRVVGCLKAHERELSDACRDVILDHGPGGRGASPHGGFSPDSRGRSK